MTKRTNGLLALATTALLGVSLAAQPGQMQQKPQEPAKGSEMSMDGMMKGCREHCQATTKSLEQMTKMMDGASASNDPAKMRAALDQARKPLTEMQEHMGMCMNMMNMMEKMHGKGGMGGMMQDGHMGMMQGQQALKFATSAAELNELCGRQVDTKTAPRATRQGKTYYFCSEADKATFEKDPAKYVK